MAKQAFKSMKLAVDTLAVIEYVNDILAEYELQGFQELTLRQVYYQLVARDKIPNRVEEYKRLADIVNKGRLCGLIDWLKITDRTRNLMSVSHWESPVDILHSAAASFRIDKWREQQYRPEVWIEKDALVGVIETVCTDLDIPFFSCRGYTSQSEMYLASKRLRRHMRGGQVPVIFHFGDHDPSGLDMTRDIRERLEMFMGGLEVERLALNFVQIGTFNPPPNPAKQVDPRFRGYQAEFGDESWELDALNPTALVELIRTHILEYRDEEEWEKAVSRENAARDRLDQPDAVPANCQQGALFKHST